MSVTSPEWSKETINQHLCYPNISQDMVNAMGGWVPPGEEVNGKTVFKKRER